MSNYYITKYLLENWIMQLGGAGEAEQRIKEEENSRGRGRDERDRHKKSIGR